MGKGPFGSKERREQRGTRRQDAHDGERRVWREALPASVLFLSSPPVLVGGGRRVLRRFGLLQIHLMSRLRRGGFRLDEAKAT